MPFKVIERGTNQKLVYELLLVIYSNFTSFTISIYKHISYLEFEILKVKPLECGDEIWRQKLES